MIVTAARVVCVTRSRGHRWGADGRDDRASWVKGERRSSALLTRVVRVT